MMMLQLPKEAMPNKPALSIIIPVFHEANTVNATISHVRSLQSAYPPEIIIVDGDPGKSTIRVIQDTSCIITTAAKGRARQMNHGASQASGDILLFLHADTTLPAAALDLIPRIMQKEQCIGGAFDLGIDSNRKIFRITERYVALRTRLTKIPFGDQAIFIRRAYFEKIGGYKDIPLMEDVELMARIRKSGDSLRIIPEKVMTSPRRWEHEGLVYCTIRNWFLQTAYILGASPERLVRWYR